MHGKGIENIRCELCVCCTLYFSFTSLIVRRLQVLATFDYKCAIGPLQLVIRHIIIHVVHCVQVGEEEMHSKKTKKDWRHFKWYLSLFLLLLLFCFFLFQCLSCSSAMRICITWTGSLTNEKRFWVTHLMLYSCQLYYPILKANWLYKGTGHLAILIWWRQGRGID